MWLLCRTRAPVHFWIWVALTFPNTSSMYWWIIDRKSILSFFLLDFFVFYNHRFLFFEILPSFDIQCCYYYLVINQYGDSGSNDNYFFLFHCFPIQLPTITIPQKNENIHDAVFFPPSREFSYYFYFNGSFSHLYLQPWLRHLWESGESHLGKEYYEWKGKRINKNSPQ